MENKGTVLILLLIIVILTVTVAVLAGLMFFSGGTGNSGSDPSQSETVKVPSDSELGLLDLFTEKKFFNLKKGDDKGTPLIQIDVSMSYFLQVKGIKNVQEKINGYTGKIREIMTRRFQDMTYSEAIDTSTMLKIKDELKKEINTLLTLNEKNKEDIVYEVIFEEWLPVGGD